MVDITIKAKIWKVKRFDDGGVSVSFSAGKDQWRTIYNINIKDEELKEVIQEGDVVIFQNCYLIKADSEKRILKYGFKVAIIESVKEDDAVSEDVPY